MDRKEKKECESPISVERAQTSTTENVFPNASYLRNFTEATVLFWTVSNYTALQYNVLYSKIFDIQGLECYFKLLKSPKKLYLCVYSEIFPNKVAEFLLIDKNNGNSLRCVAKELAVGCYVGEFQTAEYEGSKYLRNDVFNVAFKYFSSQSTFYQDTLSEVAEPLTDADELCSDYRRSFLAELSWDFIIRVSDYQFSTHRFILAAHSEFFDMFFQHNPNAYDFTCSNDIPPSIMHEILLYVYSGELRETNLQFMLSASDLAVHFSIKALCHKCSRYFLRCIDETCRRANGNDQTHSGGQEKLDMDFMRSICEEAFKYKRLEVFAQKWARYLKRNLDKFLHLDTNLSTRKCKLKMDDIIRLWRLSHVRNLKDLKNKCSMILRRCIVDPVFFDVYVKTGKEMGVNLKGVIHVAEFAVKVRSVVLSKKCAKYIFDRLEIHQTAENMTSNEEINLQTICRILNIVLKNHCIEKHQVNKCMAYCLNFMHSSKNELVPIGDLTSLIEVAYIAKILKENDFLDESVTFLKEYVQRFSETYLHEEANSLICFIRFTVRLHELSLDESLRKSSLGICHKMVRKNSLCVATQEVLRENIDLFKNLLSLSYKLKRIKPKMERDEDSKTKCREHSKKEGNENSKKKRVKITKECHKFYGKSIMLKKNCVNYIEDKVGACYNIAKKEIFSDNTLKYIAFLYKFARKPTSLQEKLNGILIDQINLCSKESNSLRQNHKLDALITICNITRKLQMLDISRRSVEALKHRIQKLNSVMRKESFGKEQNQKVFETSCIEPLVKTYKLFCRFHQRLYIDKQINETDEKSLEQKQSDTSAVAASVTRIQGEQKCDEEPQKFPYEEKTVQALLSQCEYFFNFILSKIRDSNASDTDKVRVMKCAVEICDLTRYHFDSQQMTRHLSKHGTRCHNINLRRKCLEFLAINMADDPYKSLAEPSQELLTEFMTKLYVLACELSEDINGEKRIMEDEVQLSRLPKNGELMSRKFFPLEEAHVLKLLEYWKEFFEKIRKIDISKVPDEIRKQYIARGMKLLKFASDKSRPERKLIKNAFSNYMFLSGSTAFVRREETVDFDQACKIIEFAYTAKMQDLQNKCIESYFYQFTNRKNWKQLHDLSTKLGSRSLQNVASQNQYL